jgi:hypothetical protein
MNKQQLVELVTNGRSEAEAFYVNGGPGKHEQEEHYTNGLSVVGMNVDLLCGWLSEEEGVLESFESLSAEDRRAVWEASGFHFGIFGYNDREADAWWSCQA